MAVACAVLSAEQQGIDSFWGHVIVLPLRRIGLNTAVLLNRD